MVVHESVDPKAQGKPDLGTGVTNQVSVVSVSVGTRSGSTRESVWGRAEVRGPVCVCEVVVGDARVAVANGGCEREMGREPLSVAYPLSMFAATCPPLEPSRAARPSPLFPPASTGPTRSDSTAGAGTTALTK